MSDKKYWGEYKIKEVEDLGFETELGSKVVKIHLESNLTPFEVVSERALEAFSTEEAIDLTSFQDMRMRALVHATLMQISEYHIHASEFTGFADKLGNSFEDAIQRATNFLWTGTDSSFVPGGNVLHYRTALEAESILKNIPYEDKEETADVQGGEE